jgi:Zn-dependent peptidase ImmA (M78 family)/transcriptional regulator with XRE-family HTH domain
MSTAHDIVARIERILDARPDLNQRTLAERAGLSATQMNRVMTQSRKITATELAIIAEALGVPAAQLLGEPSAQLSVAARVGSAQRVAELEGPFSRAERLLGVRELLDRVMTRPEAEPAPVLNLPTKGREKDRGRLAAVTLRSALGLEAGDAIEDLNQLAGRFGLDVSTQPLPSGLHGLLVSGARSGGATSAKTAVEASEVPAIALLNAADSLGRRRFTLAHEICHLLFGDAQAQLAIADYRRNASGRDDRWTPADLVELRADNFAGSLLAPDDGIRALAEQLGPKPAGRADTTLTLEVVRWGAALMACIAATYGMSFESAGIRANDAALLTSAERNAAHQQGAMRAFKEAGFPNVGDVLSAPADGVEPPSTLLAQALAAYQAEELGLKPLATLYDLSEPDELNDLRDQLRDAGWEPGPVLSS